MIISSIDHRCYFAPQIKVLVQSFENYWSKKRKGCIFAIEKTFISLIIIRLPTDLLADLSASKALLKSPELLRREDKLCK